MSLQRAGLLVSGRRRLISYERSHGRLPDRPTQDTQETPMAFVNERAKGAPTPKVVTDGLKRFGHGPGHGTTIRRGTCGALACISVALLFACCSPPPVQPTTEARRCSADSDCPVDAFCNFATEGCGTESGTCASRAEQKCTLDLHIY